MVMAEARVKQWGNSLGLIIPKEITKLEDINAGDLIKVEILKDKRVDAFGIFKGAPSFKEDEDEHQEFW